MRAELTQQDKGYKAVFERRLEHGADEVWSMLTDNSRLQQWFDELRMGRAGKGGKMIFDLGNGKTEELDITDYEEGHVLAFQWWADHVRFEVEEKGKGEGTSVLRLIETIQRITPQTAKDLAGWHVCLDVIGAILNDDRIDRDNEWQHWHEEYKRLLDSMTIEFE